MPSPGLIRLWDWPVRIVHWSLVALLPALWWTGEEGEIGLHKTLGLIMLGLLLFRILWGFVGSATARFGSFVRGPGAIVTYVRSLSSKHSEPMVGHNPLGGWSVVLVLSLLLAQTMIGLFAQDVDGLESGPLTHLVSYEMADQAREIHHLLFNVIMALVIIHIAAILFYWLVKRDNLIGAMITGRKRFETAVEEPRFAPGWRAVLLAAGSASLAWWIWLGAPF